MLGLTQVACIHARAEELAKREAHREAYDIAVSRAVAEFGDVERVLPAVCARWRTFAALKGPAAGQELDGAKMLLRCSAGAMRV